MDSDKNEQLLFSSQLIASLISPTIIECMAISPCGRRLYTASLAKAAGLYHVQAYDVVMGGDEAQDGGGAFHPIKTPLAFHNDEIYTICVSCTGTYVASGSYDKTIKITNPVSGVNIKTILQQRFPSFSAGSSSESASTLRTWRSLASGSATNMKNTPVGGSVVCCSFALDDKLFIYGVGSFAPGVVVLATPFFFDSSREHCIKDWPILHWFENTKGGTRSLCVAERCDDDDDNNKNASPPLLFWGSSNPVFSEAPITGALTGELLERSDARKNALERPLRTHKWQEPEADPSQFYAADDWCEQMQLSRCGKFLLVPRAGIVQVIDVAASTTSVPSSSSGAADGAQSQSLCQVQSTVATSGVATVMIQGTEHVVTTQIQRQRQRQHSAPRSSVRSVDDNDDDHRGDAERHKGGLLTVAPLRPVPATKELRDASEARNNTTSARRARDASDAVVNAHISNPRRLLSLPGFPQHLLVARTGDCPGESASLVLVKFEREEKEKM